MRRVLVLHPVSGKESHPAPADLSHRERGGGLPVGRLDIDPFHVLEKGVEPRPPEDSDLGRDSAQSDFPLADWEPDEEDALSDELLPELPDPELPDPELPDPELPDPELPDPELPDPSDDAEDEEEDEEDFFRLSVR
jgi:hypothetical protein